MVQAIESFIFDGEVMEEKEIDLCGHCDFSGKAARHTYWEDGSIKSFLCPV